MNRRRMLKLGLAGLAPFVAAGLSGCGIVAGTRALIGLDPKPVTPDWKALALRADDDANANSALAVDVVLVKETAMLDSLLAMPSSKWFSSRSDLQRSFPDALTVYPYELVPGQVIKLNSKLWDGQKAWAALVFASYTTPGEHRQRLLLNNGGYVVQLGAQGFSASEIKAGAVL